MNFGSKFVYVYDHSDEESVSDESFELDNDDFDEPSHQPQASRPNRLVSAGGSKPRPKSTTGIASKLKGIFRGTSCSI